MWFKSGTLHDAQITYHFKKTLKQAENFELLDWLNTKDGYVAYIVLLDQFSRHIYRNTPSAYKNDNHSLAAADFGLEKYLNELTANEKLFVLMPYQHTENIDYQKKGIGILADLIQNENKKNNRSVLQAALQHQIGHFNVLKRFGRFPKRNKILRWAPTIEEKTYIQKTPNLPY
tara:strand:+ start:285 stop:806 length:522 start_codon:yes stop_codon:yes gene_type:complete